MYYLFILFFLSSCYLGPKNIAPEVSLPSRYEKENGLEDTITICQNENILSTWWEQFHDPILESLIEKAIQKNFDIKTAAELIYQARTSVTIATAKLLPALGTFGAVAKTQLPKDQVTSLIPIPAPVTAPTPSLIKQFFALGLDASWELDFFGKNSSAKRAASYNLQATEEQSKYIQMIIVAEVARVYTHIRSLQQQLLLTKKKISMEEKLLLHTQQLRLSGLDNAIEEETMQASLYSVKSEAPSIEQELEQSLENLTLLLGGDLGELKQSLQKPGRIPLALGRIPLGLPSGLLQRRPDIKEAEYNLYSAGAAIGEAKANLFPSFELTGLLGNTNQQVSRLFRSSSNFWLILPTINWSLFQGGRVLAQIKNATSKQKVAAIQYEKIVSSALKEVENALIGYAKQTLRTQDLIAEYKAKKTLTTLSQNLLSSGLIDESSLLKQYEQLFTTEIHCIEVKEEAMKNLILLYKSLGGGWDINSQK